MKKPDCFVDDHRVLALRNMRPRLNDSCLVQHPPEVVVGIALHNQAGHIAQCLESVFAQQVEWERLAVIILNDSSRDNWEECACDYLSDPRVIVIDANCGSPTHARNAILDYVDTNMPSVKWVARLDADDCFSCPASLQAAVSLAEREGAGFVLGGNRLRLSADNYLARCNRATSDLLNPEWVLNRLREMAEGVAENELPSCNLVLATGTGWRYPDMKSAEDHGLVADLLINHTGRGAILTEPLYSDYTLQGSTTQNNIRLKEHFRARSFLARIASVWLRSKTMPGELLGYGREGVVKRCGRHVFKHFYERRLSDEKVEWLKYAFAGSSFFPCCAEWYREDDAWCCKYDYTPTVATDGISESEIREFLLECLKKRIVCLNIKSRNFRRTDQGALLFVDLGNDIIPMNIDCFVDSAARMYCIFKLGWGDDELRRRKSGPGKQETLKSIPGFQEFYLNLLSQYANEQWAAQSVPETVKAGYPASEVTLLIKACAMDSHTLIAQVRSIVYQLQTPRVFNERILAIDPYRGPFLRQYTPGDYDDLMVKACRLKNEGLIDRFIIAPSEPAEVTGVNRRWFNIESPFSHSADNIPVTPQLWAFEMVKTRYVLQCDADVLIGNHDLEHDYLSDMLNAVQGEDVLGVAFNIPHPPVSGFGPYDAPEGEYVPEVRCGLLDLKRIRECLPLPNELQDGRLVLSWYRSLQACQRQQGLRTLRGGDYRTFYIHPLNEHKKDASKLSVIRDLTSQACLPHHQYEKWDLDTDNGHWGYSPRKEKIVFLSKGRNTPLPRLRRFVASLMMQDNQNFGIIVIDDASEDQSSFLLPHFLKPLQNRTTLIRHSSPQGRMPNFIQGITEICAEPETLIVILDLDDALMDSSVVSRLQIEVARGHDVILGAMFRPDKPVKCYHPVFENPRDVWGGEVWIHLRSFKKRLFDSVRHDQFMIDGDWIEHCTDYATMIPIVERSSNPLYIPEYLYYHERSTQKTPELNKRKNYIIQDILRRS